MRLLRFPSRFSRPPAGVVAVFVVLCGAALAPGQSFPRDPVDRLEQVLKAQLRIPTGAVTPDAESLAFRKTSLEKAAEALKTPGEIRRALMLQDWKDLSPEAVGEIDSAVRKQLEEKLQTDLRAVLTNPKGSRESRLAAVTFVGDLAIVVRATGKKRDLGRVFGPDLEKLLSDDDRAIRAAAARALGKINFDPMLLAKPPLIVAMLDAKEVEQRRAAAEGLAGMMRVVHELANGNIISLVDAATRQDVVDAGRVVVDATVKGLKDDDPVVRRFCLEGIGIAALAMRDHIRGPRKRSEFPPEDRKLTEAEKDIIEAYRLEVAREREELNELITALNGAAIPVAKALQDPVAQNRYLASQALENMGFTRLQLLRRQTSIPTYPENGKDKEAKPKPPEVLMPKGLAGAREALASALTDRDQRVRLAAINALESLEAEAAPAAEAIIKALDDSSHFVRWGACRTLAKIAPEAADKAAPALAAHLNDPDYSVQLAAAEALERYGTAAKSAVAALGAAVSRGDAEKRVAVIEALIAIGADAEPAIPALAKAVEDKDPRVRKAAADGLAKFGPLAKKAIPALKTALGDSDPDVRKAASDALLAVDR